jgi:uncharacterized Rossmann fold enzyme
MDFPQWESFYCEILKAFGFPREADEDSARKLHDALKGRTPSLTVLEKLIKGKDVWVVGNAPSLAKDLERAVPDGTIIAADDAASILMSKGIRPHIIVTDLDGDIEDIIGANEQGTVVLVHAHGDNIQEIEKYTPRFKDRVIGTTQAEPFDDIHNFGGFTDGDRGVFLADHFRAKTIKLLGFDFENINTEKDSEGKRKKLDWAYTLIESLGNPCITYWSPSSS